LVGYDWACAATDAAITDTAVSASVTARDFLCMKVPVEKSIRVGRDFPLRVALVGYLENEGRDVHAVVLFSCGVDDSRLSARRVFLQNTNRNIL
jgi:hypothetical protein